MNVFEDIAREVTSRVKHRAGERFRFGCVLLSLKGDVLGRWDE
jgi:hypothetical protein